LNGATFGWNLLGSLSPPCGFGNVVGGVLFISLAWYLTDHPQAAAARRTEAASASAAMATR
jgi:formate/nitrite transporter FocA (FNT family)